MPQPPLQPLRPTIASPLPTPLLHDPSTFCTSQKHQYFGTGFLEWWEQSQIESDNHPPPPRLLLYLQLDCLYEHVDLPMQITLGQNHIPKTS